MASDVGSAIDDVSVADPSMVSCSADPTTASETMLSSADEKTVVFVEKSTKANQKSAASKGGTTSEKRGEGSLCETQQPSIVEEPNALENADDPKKSKTKKSKNKEKPSDPEKPTDPEKPPEQEKDSKTEEGEEKDKQKESKTHKNTMKILVKKNAQAFKDIDSVTTCCLWFYGFCSLASCLSPILSVACIVLAAIHINDCTIEPYVPIFVLVFASTLLLGSILSFCCGPETEDKEKKGFSNPCASCFCCLLTTFAFCWFIAGNVWVYGNRAAVQYNHQIMKAQDAPSESSGNNTQRLSDVLTKSLSLTSLSGNGTTVSYLSINMTSSATLAASLPANPLDPLNNTTSNTSSIETLVDNEFYCNETIYVLAFVMVTSLYAICAISCLCSCCAVCVLGRGVKKSEDKKVKVTKTDSLTKVVTKTDSVSKTGEPVSTTVETSTKTSHVSVTA